MAKRVEATGVTAYYGSFKAIDNINLSVEPKTVTALIGPSGCGKSTFLRSINRMHEVLPGARVEGSLTVDDENIYDKDVDVTAVRRMIGMVFQRPNPFPTMSIFDNVVAGLKLNGVRRKSVLADAAEKALRSANLWDEVKDRLGKPGAGLSGGQQQRLCIA
ncbi:phosphate ABC transporter ATP-binding protein, partial [Asanoa ferruginea]